MPKILLYILIYLTMGIVLEIVNILQSSKTVVSFTRWSCILGLMFMLLDSFCLLGNCWFEG